MARKSGKSATSLGEEQTESTSTETGGSEGGSARAQKTISKASAAREALAEGYTVPREAIVRIKQRYGIEMSPQQFSAEKCRLKARSGDREFSFLRDQGTGSEAGHKPARGGTLGEPDLLESLEVMKPLIDRLGADKVRRLVDLLG